MCINFYQYVPPPIFFQMATRECRYRRFRGEVEAPPHWYSRYIMRAYGVFEGFRQAVGAFMSTVNHLQEDTHTHTHTCTYKDGHTLGHMLTQEQRKE